MKCECGCIYFYSEDPQTSLIDHIKKEAKLFYVRCSGITHLKRKGG